MNEASLSESITKLLENAVTPFVRINRELVAIRNEEGGYTVINEREKMIDPEPHGRAGEAQFDSIDDFLRYLRMFGGVGEGIDGVAVWVKPAMNSDGSGVYIGMAILDYHVGRNDEESEVMVHGFCRNTAKLTLRVHPLYEVVRRMFSWQTQTDFSNLIRAAGSVWRDPTRNDMLTLARDLRITSTSEYANSFDDANGSRNIVYRQQNTAVAGNTTTERTIVMPEEVKIECPMILDTPAYALALRLETRPPSKSGEQCSMRLVYDNETIDRLEIVDVAIARIRDAGFNVMRGTYAHVPKVA